MNFGWAISEIKSGRCVARKRWEPHSMTLAIKHPGPDAEMTMPFIYLRKPNGYSCPWNPCQTDMLADDWMEVRPPCQPSESAEGPPPCCVGCADYDPDEACIGCSRLSGKTGDDDHYRVSGAREERGASCERTGERCEWARTDGTCGHPATAVGLTCPRKSSEGGGEGEQDSYYELVNEMCQHIPIPGEPTHAECAKWLADHHEELFRIEFPASRGVT